MDAKRGEVTVAEIDLRVGGKWRYVMVADGGFEVGFHGEYREIVPNERIVSTEVYEGVPAGGEADAEHADLTEADGRTTLTVLVQAPSKVVRDAIIDPVWKPGCRTRWTCSSRSRAPSADRIARGAAPARSLASAGRANS